MEQRWYDIDGKIPKNSKINLTQCQFLLHKSTELGANPGHGGQMPTSNHLEYDTAFSVDNLENIHRTKRSVFVRVLNEYSI
jgi:hypothetical protein